MPTISLGWTGVSQYKLWSLYFCLEKITSITRHELVSILTYHFRFWVSNWSCRRTLSYLSCLNNGRVLILFRTQNRRTKTFGFSISLPLANTDVHPTKKCFINYFGTVHLFIFLRYARNSFGMISMEWF